MPENQIEQVLLDRIDNVLATLKTIAATYDSNRNSPPEELARFQEACAATVSLGNQFYGAESVQMREMLSAVEGLRAINRYPGVMDGRISQVLTGFLANLNQEIRLGLLRDIAQQAAGEVLGDFVVLADSAFSTGQKDVAAVLASAALEDALKRKATGLGIQTEDKELSSVVNALKAKGFLQGAEGKIVQGFVTLRNRALHADWQKITGPDVASLLGYLKTFLADRM